MGISHNRTNKYGAKKTEFDGYTFDSKVECEYYRHLLTKYPKEDIIVHPPSVSLLPTVSWKLDFLIQSEGAYVDVKGFETREFIVKANIWKSLGSCPLWIVDKIPIIGWNVKVIPAGDCNWFRLTL